MILTCSVKGHEMNFVTHVCLDQSCLSGAGLICSDCAQKIHATHNLMLMSDFFQQFKKNVSKQRAELQFKADFENIQAVRSEMANNLASISKGLQELISNYGQLMVGQIDFDAQGIAKQIENTEA